MRPSWCWGLLAIGLLTVGSRVSHSRGQPQAPDRLAVASEAVRVDGFGETLANAKETALENAQQEVEKQLAKRYARSGWQPPIERLRREYLLERHVIRLEEQKEQDHNGRPQYCVVYRIDVTPAYLHELDGVAREQRMLARHLIVARALAGLVVLLLTVYGYLRLEEATRGYYTRMLRMVAVGLMMLVGVGLWLSL